MKILITGGTGFVGSAMAQALHAQGHVVTVIGSSGKSCRRHQALAGLNCITADTTRPGHWQDAVASQNACGPARPPRPFSRPRAADATCPG